MPEVSQLVVGPLLVGERVVQLVEVRPGLDVEAAVAGVKGQHAALAVDLIGGPGGEGVAGQAVGEAGVDGGQPVGVAGLGQR